MADIQDHRNPPARRNAPTGRSRGPVNILWLILAIVAAVLLVALARSLLVPSRTWETRIEAAGLEVFGVGTWSTVAARGGASSAAGVTYPGAIGVDRAGSFYVGSNMGNPAAKFSMDGRFVGLLDLGEPGDGRRRSGVRGFASDRAGNIYVAADDQVQKLDAAGQVLARWGGQGDEPGQFRYLIGVVSGLGVDGAGNVFVADTGNNRVQKLGADGRFLCAWGTKGTGDGQFDRPMGLAVDGKGLVYVADTGNHRIQKFGPDGRFITSWGTQGAERGRFNSPMGLAVDAEDRLYVLDAGNSRVQVFTGEGRFLGTWGSPGVADGQFHRPSALAIAPLGTIWVTDSGNHRLQGFRVARFVAPSVPTAVVPSPVPGIPTLFIPTPAAALTPVPTPPPGGERRRVDTSGLEAYHLGGWGLNLKADGQFEFPLGVATDRAGNVYAVDRFARVRKTSAGGDILGQWGPPASGDSRDLGLRGIGVDGAGNVYVADLTGSLIRKYSSAGRPLREWGAPGSGEGQFDKPRGLAVEPGGDVYVVDSGNYRVQRFDANGRFLGSWRPQVSGDDQYAYLLGVAVGPDGGVYVAATNGVQRFTKEGRFVSWVSLPVLNDLPASPRGLAVDRQGRVYLAAGGLVHVFDPQGRGIGFWGLDGGGARLPWRAEALAVGWAGEVYVVDARNLRLHKFDVRLGD